MPYSPEHKAETRKRIVSSARKLFNRRGLIDVSIDQIMADAGLTRGGFYNHFATKEDLYAEAITQILDCEKVDENGVPIDFGQPPDVIAQTILHAYLSDGHFADRDNTCSLVAFPSDVARGGEAARKAYQQVFQAMVGLLETSQENRPDARAKALSMAMLCIGGMTLARAMADEPLSDEIRAVALRAALDAGGFGMQPAAAAAE